VRAFAAIIGVGVVSRSVVSARARRRAIFRSVAVVIARAFASRRGARASRRTIISGVNIEGSIARGAAAARGASRAEAL
jgi:hypothetical protein